MHTQSRINVSCDAVEARHATRNSLPVRMVPDPPLPVASEDVVRWEGRQGRLVGAAPRRRGNCVDTEGSVGRPADGVFIRKSDLFSVMKYLRRNEIKIFRNEF